VFRPVRFVVGCLPKGLQLKLRRYVANNLVVTEAHQKLPAETAAALMARTDALLLLQERRINALEMRVSELMDGFEAKRAKAA